MAETGPYGLSFIIDPPTPVASPLEAVRAYWDRKRGERNMARRADIDPQELKEHLRHLFLVDVLADREFRFRLLGTEITRRYGRDSTGKTLREVYGNEPPLLDWYNNVLTAVVTSKRPVLSGGPLRAIRKEFMTIEAIHLPLSEDGATVTMVFGAVHITPGEGRKESAGVSHR